MVSGGGVVGPRLTHYQEAPPYPPIVWAVLFTITLKSA